MSECNCCIKPDDGRDETVCGEESDDGLSCTKPDGHDGPHSACSLGNHPAEVWE